MSNELKHADVICHMARHGFESVEYRAFEESAWYMGSGDMTPLSHSYFEWRIKPATITYTVTVPMPMREKPPVGGEYFLIESPRILCSTWDNDNIDKERFDAGNCWATEADAQAAFDAIFGPLKASK